MKQDDIKLENERYFPNHRLDREIGLAEYEAAANRLSNDERALSWSTNSSVLLATAVGYISLNSSTYIEGLTGTGIDPETFRRILLLAIVLFGYFAILHLANLFKSLVFAERKIVVLRRMLGVSYGDTTLVLPNWRIEGASNPFVIKLFPGYFSPASFPVHVILLTTSLSIFVLSPSFFVAIKDYLPYSESHPSRMQVSLASTCYLFGLIIFRRQLKEANENIYQSISKFIARFFGVALIQNFEDGIYRLRIEIAEIRRVKTDLEHGKDLAIFIEDRGFHEHSGINWRGIGRALWGKLTRQNRGGGSSITQQLVRSQFIVRPRNSIGRKLTEMILALWIEKCMKKDDILLGYLATVRFERGIYGFHRAFRHFFGDDAKTVHKWEAFILIERLGNIKGKFLGRRVRQLLQDGISREQISLDDAKLSLGYYSAMIDHHFQTVAGDLSPNEVLVELTQAS